MGLRRQPYWKQVNQGARWTGRAEGCTWPASRASFRTAAQEGSPVASCSQQCEGHRVGGESLGRLHRQHKGVKVTF